jgi:hypothetical protein
LGVVPIDPAESLFDVPDADLTPGKFGSVSRIVSYIERSGYLVE